MAFQKVAEVEDFEKKNKKLVVVGDQEILICKVDGDYYAINNKCPHMGGSLYKGKLENGIVTCPRHGSKYDAKTGKALDKAKILFVKISVEDDKSYPLKRQENDILIDVN